MTDRLLKKWGEHYLLLMMLVTRLFALIGGGLVIYYINLTVSLATSDGVLKKGNTEFTLTFADSSGKPIDVGAVALTFHMPQMGTMSEMNDAATFTTTETPGVYRGKADIEVGGEWQTKITYEGPAGRGQFSFPVTAQ